MSGDLPASALMHADLVETLTRMWTSVLGVDTIGTDEDFFDLGGSSLAAVAVVEQINARYGVELPVNAMFGIVTIAEMVEAIRARAAAGAAASVRQTDAIPPPQRILPADPLTTARTLPNSTDNPSAAEGPVQ